MSISINGTEPALTQRQIDEVRAAEITTSPAVADTLHRLKQVVDKLSDLKAENQYDQVKKLLNNDPLKGPLTAVMRDHGPDRVQMMQI